MTFGPASVLFLEPKALVLYASHGPKDMRSRSTLTLASLVILLVPPINRLIPTRIEMLLVKTMVSFTSWMHTPSVRKSYFVSPVSFIVL